MSTPNAWAKRVGEADWAALAAADGIIFGTPTRYGNMAGQMQAFLDSTGGLWAQGALVGKVGGAFVSTATQHGGQETTIRAVHTALLHHGFILVGLPYAWQGQMGHHEVTGGTPYGASTVAGGQGERHQGRESGPLARAQPSAVDDRERAARGEQGDVGILERDFRIIGADHAGQQRERAVLQLHDRALQGGQRGRVRDEIVVDGDGHRHLEVVLLAFLLEPLAQLLPREVEYWVTSPHCIRVDTHLSTHIHLARLTSTFRGPCGPSCG